MIQQTVHVIAVPDLEKSAAYYQEVLGFTIEEIGDPGWRFFRRDNCRIMAGHCPDAIPPEEVGDTRTLHISWWTPWINILQRSLNKGPTLSSRSAASLGR